jgi:hypothetical protein
VLRSLRALLWLTLLLVGCSGVIGRPTVSASPTSTGDHSGSPVADLSTTVRTLELGDVVDGVPCLDVEFLGQHLHVHLQILKDGVEIPIPAGIGVGQPWEVEPSGFVVSGRCFAWIHSHDGSGVVHLVSPVEESFTLGQLFDVWGQPLAANSALGYQGPLTILVNGARVDGDPRSLTMANLQNIVLLLGTPPAVPPPALYDFTATRM